MSVKNQVLREHVNHQSSQNVNRNTDISVFTELFWFELVQINLNLIKHSRDLKHRQLSGAFFLALIPDINSVV
jgi:hypothetical protein